MSCLCWKDLIYYIDTIMVAKQKIWIVVFWAVKFNPEGRSITFLQNADNRLQYHTASQHKRPQSASSVLWESQMWNMHVVVF
jgi:hypothetical protein